MRLLILNLLLATSIFAQQDSLFVRWNQAGYFSKGPKSVIINSYNNLKGKAWFIKKGDSTLLKGAIKQFLTSRGDHTNFKYNYKIDFSGITRNGNYKLIFEEKEYDLKIDSNPVQQFLPEILRYLRQQRSASKHTVDKAPAHFNDSIAPLHLQNENKMEWLASTPQKTANVIGGWYDAGDYLKFNLTSAYTTYLLLSAYEANPQLFSFKNHSKTQYNDLLDEAKFGLDFLERCYINDSTFVIQVGDERDHQFGDRLATDDKNMHRYAFTSLSRPHLAYNAAAYAIAARVFNPIDSLLAAHYLDLGKKLFVLANKHREAYWYQKGHEIFYADKNGYDNILLASAELYKTTGDKLYADKAKFYCTMAGRAYWASWSDFNMVAHAKSGKIIARSTQFLLDDLDGFYSKTQQPNNIWGVPHDYTWGSLYSFFGVANAAILYNEGYAQNSKSPFINIAYDMIDYTFGKNNWGVSFVASKKLKNSVQNIYSQTYKLQPKLFPTGAIAEGPGGIEDHLANKQWFSLSKDAYKMEEFNTSKVVFFDDATDFQTMETTIGGLADAIYFLSLASTYLK